MASIANKARPARLHHSAGIFIFMRCGYLRVPAGGVAM
jgi:hypothetical protein